MRKRFQRVMAWMLTVLMILTYIPTDVWASGQNVVTLYAPTTAALTEFLLLNEGRLVNHFNRVERERWIVGLSKSHSSWINEKLKSRFGISLFVPEDMSAYKEETDFFWGSNNANRGRTDILVYSFPYTARGIYRRLSGRYA